MFFYCLNKIKDEHITHLIAFTEGFIEYHSQSCEILKDISKTLKERFAENKIIL